MRGPFLLGAFAALVAPRPMHGDSAIAFLINLAIATVCGALVVAGVIACAHDD